MVLLCQFPPQFPYIMLCGVCAVFFSLLLYISRRREQQSREQQSDTQHTQQETERPTRGREDERTQRGALVFQVDGARIME